MNAEVLLEHFHRLGDAPDAVPRLRQFILDLAMRGKLVVQDQKEEPAAVLLARIDALVSKAVIAGKLRKQVDRIELDDVPYELPSGWRWVHFGRIAEFSAGRTPSRNDHSFWNTGDYPWVSIADLIDDGEVVETKETVSKKAKSLFGGDPSAQGTMIMSFKLTIGKISRLGVDAYHNEAIVSIYPHEPELDGYLFKVLPQCARAGKTKDAIKGATLNRDSIHNILIPLPPLPEQHRIVAKVDELMALCDRLEAAQQEREQRRTRLTAASWQALTSESDPNAARFALEQLPALTNRPQQISALRQTILDLAVRGRLVKQDEKDEPAEVLLKRLKVAPALDVPFEIPKNWCWATTGSISDARLGKMLDRAKNTGTMRRYLRNINVRWYDFDMSDVHQMPMKDVELDELRLHSGDVLICEGGYPGRAAVWDERESEVYFQKALHRIRFPEGVHPLYFTHTLKQSDDSGRLAEYFTGVGIKHFTGRGLASYIFPLPPLAEQMRIVAKVDELMRLCDALEAALVRGEEVKGRLLEAVLHTEVVPRTQPPAPVQLRVAAGAPKPQRAYVETEVELSLAADPVAGLVKRGPGRPRKATAAGENDTAEAILGYLQAHAGWHGKAGILEATGVEASEWNAAIKELLEAGKVERQGEKKGARYRGLPHDRRSGERSSQS